MRFQSIEDASLAMTQPLIIQEEETFKDLSTPYILTDAFKLKRTKVLPGLMDFLKKYPKTQHPNNDALLKKL